MIAFTPLALVVLLCSAYVFSAPTQAPLQAPEPESRGKLRGRFLHITDIHPDPYYNTGASVSSACHRKKPKKDKERAGFYGTPFSDCDSPFRLTNLTLDFLSKNWASEVDFVIWTGDNARHDNDRKQPRTLKEIYELNRVIAAKMEEVFVKKGVPVVPSLGNNDVWPHNILAAGPNDIISKFSSLWSTFVPFPSYQVFQRGAYYSVEVIPKQLAVISLNTMYFYDSNKAVGGCEFNDPDDPGNLQFDWLEVQLETFRKRGMQVWLSGHVPPSPGNYFPECHVRYVELSLRFQDTILGHLYGHMNNDHFFFVEADDLQFPSKSDTLHARHDGESVLAHDELYDALLKDFSALPQKAKKADYDKYGVVNVSPSVVPNPYLPSFRVFSYNVTNAQDRRFQGPDGGVEGSGKRKHGHRHGGGSRDTYCKKRAYQDTWRCNLNEPWYSDPDAPSRRNTLWSPLGYAQYYLEEEQLVDKTHRPKFKLEYLTYRPEELHPPDNFTYPVPLRHLPRSLRDWTGSKESKYAPYKMKDLTIPSWIQLAQKLGRPEKTKLRRRFRKYMYMGDE
ncbi:hypothetical protein DENSPDRAFT_831193 [Dentipellis sp. KUC8613]|nr:hypothetical protein DENSPDRAFT_831193 [Dentipellis sp. KUC8613]